MSTQTHAEDELDDELLDGVLDEFTSTSISEARPATSQPTTSGPKQTTISQAEQHNNDRQGGNATDQDLDNLLDDDFAKQLAAGMEELFQDMDEKDDVKAAFEKIWASFDEQARGDVPAAPETSATGPSIRSGKSFQDTIAETMSKLKNSSEEVDNSIKSSDDQTDAFMAEMLKQLESLGGEGGEEGGDFQQMLEQMMEQMMSKELLYEPMKDLKDKYPAWLTENAPPKTPADEYARYEQQFDYVKTIVAKYEDPSYDDKDPTKAKEIVTLMQQMQDCGQPPTGLMEDLAPGLDLGPDGIPKLPDGECSVM
ncbi:hypothetical protein BZG36_00205 [Bifiguratus adelaidae]|uniref:Uncharacterized protein n=1 Tax=Bifiguratus adelaidae TaxID=1938954 RepID=A0A261Y8Q4_9FUNG|nr:hypothetical protein BZG36_00205 [Bifiguratus adelaidae]